MADQRLKVLYIAGTARCGSTLLDRVLGESSGFLSAGELNFVWERGILNNEPCSCHTPVPQCAFWTKVFRTGFGGFDPAGALEMSTAGLSSVRSREVGLLRLSHTLTRGRQESTSDTVGAVVSV